MPNVEVTPELIELIKNERKNRKITGADLSEQLEKSKSYISQLENNNISKIDLYLLKKIFRTITSFSEEKQFDAYMDNLLENLAVSLTDEELERQKWAIKFDVDVRRIMIPDSIIEYIKEKLVALNIKPQELINVINENRDLKDTNLDENELRIETIEMSNGMEFDISKKIKLEEGFIESVLIKKIRKTTYINLSYIIANILMLEGRTRDDASNEVRKLLKEHKVFTLFDRKRLLSSPDNDNFDQLPNYKKYIKLRNIIIEMFDALEEFDTESAMRVLLRLYWNFKVDKFSTARLISIPLQNPKHQLDHDDRKELLSRIEAVVKEYFREVNTREPKVNDEFDLKSEL